MQIKVRCISQVSKILLQLWITCKAACSSTPRTFMNEIHRNPYRYSLSQISHMKMILMNTTTLYHILRSLDPLLRIDGRKRTIRTREITMQSSTVFSEQVTPVHTYRFDGLAGTECVRQCWVLSPELFPSCYIWDWLHMRATLFVTVGLNYKYVICKVHLPPLEGQERRTTRSVFLSFVLHYFGPSTRFFCSYFTIFQWSAIGPSL